ncbi:hypothetical protein LTS18_012683, partial [Coniosporium uncinatum]
WLCWDAQFPGAEELDLHVVVGRLRRQIFTENHPAVLQSYLNCATYYEVVENTPEASKVYFVCTNISRTVLGNFHPLTVECAIRYLRLTEGMTTPSRTEIMTNRENVMLILVAAYERQFGINSDMVIRTREMLAELYIHIHEEQRAHEILRIIHGETVDRHGKDSNKTRDVNEHLRITLSKHRGDQNLDEYEHGIFTDDDDEEEVDHVFDLGYVGMLVRNAESFVSQKNFVMAEETYVELWQQLSEKCRTSRSVEWHEKKIDVVQAYSRFLKSQKRETQTSAILTCLWQEYEHHELVFSESIISRLTETAQILKSVGVYTAALAIFRHASSFYKSTRKADSREFSRIEEEIAITSIEVVKHSLASSGTTDETNTVSESSFQEIFRSMIMNKSKAIDSTTISLAKKLTEQYMEQKKWTEAVTVIESTLHRTWTSFLSASVHDVTLTSTFLQESIELIEHLAECCMQQRLFEKVENIYVRLFRAALSSPEKDRKLLDAAKAYLISFYDKNGYPDRAIGILQDLLV